MNRILDFFKVHFSVALYWFVTTMAIGSSIHLYQAIKSHQTKIEYYQSNAEIYKAE